MSAAALGKVLLRYLPLALLALAWEACARFELVSSSALPSLTKVAAAWWDLAKSGDLVENGAASLWRAGAGLAIAIVVGAVLGIGMATWRAADVALGPLVDMFYPLPKSALIPVTALWLGFGDGARSSERTLIWSARSLGASRLRMLRDVIVPSAMPEMLSGIRTALAISFVLLVASELIVARAGLGYLIGFLGSNGTYDSMFAVVLTVAFLGFVADRIYLLIMRRALAWRE